MKKVLGKGLSALIPDSYISQVSEKPKVENPLSNLKAEESLKQSGFQLIPIEKIAAHQDQPRKGFPPEGIEELAASIKEKGILQPVVVSRSPHPGEYLLICGERRLRAARLCGLQEIPAVVKEVARDEFLEWALIENIQREDLNPLEEAEACQRLVEDRRYSQEELAKRIGKDRSTVANMLRLLRLPDEVRQYLGSGRLSTGHARALLALMTPEHQRQLAKRIVEETLSVRQVEAIVNRSNAHKRKAKLARHLSPEIVDLEERLARHLGTQVKIYPKKNQIQGRLEIHYFSLDDLDRILQTIHLPKE